MIEKLPRITIQQAISYLLLILTYAKLTLATIASFLIYFGLPEPERKKHSKKHWTRIGIRLTIHRKAGDVRDFQGASYAISSMVYWLGPMIANWTGLR